MTLHDDGIAEPCDQGTNFYLKDSDIGKATRAEGSFEQLNELNPYVKVVIHKGEITEELLKEHSVVVITDFFDKSKLIEWSNICHKNNVGFITASMLGLYGYAFLDYGEAHRVHDKDGEEVRNTIVASISNDENGLVTSHDDKRHGFQDDDWV